MDKLTQYLILAEQLFAILKTTADEFKSLYLKLDRPLTTQEKVSIGLYKKMYFTFQSLVIDAKLESSHAIHHLKTLTEILIHLSWINTANSEIRSKFVLAKSYKKKIESYKANESDINLIEQWQVEFEDLIKDHKKDYGKFYKKKIEDLAKECELNSIYKRIYKLSCESSHLSDLIDYMPLTPANISLAPPPTTIHWANIALEGGLFIILELLKGCLNHTLLEENSSGYKKTLTSQLIVLEKEYDRIKARAAV